ncbi:Arc family DNA-binding protein [Acidovorax sp. PRC11]|uniref:Arc family DNA-binding protein n=1 Tax=Acidovorax sp. PRC11 TaxID=2962592 RepID=UPI0028810430|nr:Arc family DNA-binding protein [Acidovorax sp. PRC11]MDT0137749.1 Arc family DNA-binding protein [Acidovorax sp. PRC11]
MAKTPKTTTAPTGSIAPFGLRMLPELRDRVEESAKESGRSMNAEIVERLSRSYQSDDTIRLLRGNIELLRTLANFITLRHNHPEVMAPMEGAMLKMARAVQATEDESKLRTAIEPSMREYTAGLEAFLDRVNEMLGPGWAKELPESSRKPKPKP